MCSAPRALAFAVCLILSPAGWAQQPADQAAQKLTIAQAVAFAWEHSPVLQAIRQEVPAAEARLRRARSEGRLQASTTTFLTTGTMQSIVGGAEPVQPRSNLLVAEDQMLDQSLTVMYPLSTGGRVAAEVAKSNGGLRTARAEVEAALLEVAYMVREGYWTVLLNQAVAKIREQSLEEQRERLRVDQAAYDAGKVPVYYVLRDKAEVANAVQELVNADRDVETALLRLKTNMGMEAAAPLELAADLTYTAEAAPEPQAAVEEALKTRPELRAALARLEAARQEVQSRRSSYRPQVSMNLMLDATKISGVSATGGYTVGVAASLPILDGGRRTAEVAEARAMQRRTDSERATLALQTEEQVRSALLQMSAAARNVETAQAALASAEEDYRVASQRYFAGKAINLEPIEALSVLVRARMNLAQATYAYRMAQDALARAMGRLPASEPALSTPAAQ